MEAATTRAPITTTTAMAMDRAVATRTSCVPGLVHGVGTKPC